MKQEVQLASSSSTPSSVGFRFEGRDYRFRTAGADDLIHQEFLHFGTFLEAPTLAAIGRRGLRGVYFDIGANLGAHSVFFANHCRATRVLAFEGNPEMTAIWHENVGCNARSGLCALVDRFVSVHENLSFHRDPANSGGSNVAAETGGRYRSVRLDDFISEHPVFIKIDVEGHELDVLKSGVTLLEQCRPDLCIEILSPFDSPIYSWLRERGYTWYGVLSNSNNYFIFDKSFLARVASTMEVSRFEVCKALAWRLRVLLSAKRRLISWSDAVSSVLSRGYPLPQDRPLPPIRKPANS